jgi:hypothetical protein
VNPRVAGFSLGYVTKVTIAAVIGILFLKWLTAKVPIPGLSAAAAAV